MTNGVPPAFIRRAAAADQAAITRLVRAARINPLGLHWARFVVAEAGGLVVGTGQIKLHPGGSRELASIAVTPGRQGEGLARAIIRALQRDAGPPLYLTCASHLGGFYPRFGFRLLHPAEMPPVFRWRHRFANLILAALNSSIRLLVMGWEDGAAGRVGG